MPLRRFAVQWFLGALAIMLGLGTFDAIVPEDQGWFGYLRLTRGGQLTSAAVERVAPGNHCQADYQFEVADATFRGTGADCSARIGERVGVTYLIANPTRSCLGVAKDHLANEIAFIVFAGLIAAPVLILSAQFQRGKREGLQAA